MAAVKVTWSLFYTITTIGAFLITSSDLCLTLLLWNFWVGFPDIKDLYPFTGNFILLSCLVTRNINLLLLLAHLLIAFLKAEHLYELASLSREILELFVREYGIPESPRMGRAQKKRKIFRIIKAISSQIRDPDFRREAITVLDFIERGMHTQVDSGWPA
ncbi:hypothetical protein C8J56DRAFT_1164929, partial [Mycena floridula]